MDEQTLYADPQIKVTSKEIRLANASYQIAAVTSVSTHHEPRDEGRRSKGFALGAIAVAPWVYMFLTKTDEAVVALWILLIGSMSFVLGIASIVNLYGYYSHTPTTLVQIGVGGVPTNIAQSADDEWAKKVANAIRVAVSTRHEKYLPLDHDPRVTVLHHAHPIIVLHFA